MAVGVRAPDVVEKLSGVKDLTCSVASSNILWVQERFEAAGPTFDAVVKAAHHWHSAVELMKVIPVTAGSSAVEAVARDLNEKASKPAPLFTARQVDGGIEADLQSPPGGAEVDRDLRRMFGELNSRGIAGSASRLPADMKRIRSAVNRSTPYSLVVVDEVFMDQAPATRTRRTRELVGRLGEVIQAPVVSAEDLGQLLQTSRSVYLRMAALALVVVGVMLLVFNYQKEVLEFFAPTSAAAKIVASVVLLLVVPVFAVIYGTLTTSVLKLFHVE
jgi:hypothetical protein